VKHPVPMLGFNKSPTCSYNHTKDLTAALHAEISPQGVDAINVIIGGPVTKIQFPLSELMHLEARESGNDQDLVDLNIDPSSIAFPPNKFVTEWTPIGELFRDLHTGVSVVRWTENQVLARYRFRANRQKDGSSKPSLLVEALVLDAATGTWSAMGAPKKQLLSYLGCWALGPAP